MQGMSERQYAAHAGLSRGAIQKAKLAGRLVLHGDGSIDAAASDARRAAATDPAKQRTALRGKTGAVGGRGLKPVPEAAVSAVYETLHGEERFRDSEAGSASGASGATNGLAAPGAAGGMTFLQARTANEVLKAQERRIRLARLKGELIERDRAKALVFRLARQERDAWASWPARVAGLMAAELGLEAGAMQQALETHVRAQLAALAELRIDL